MEQGTRRVIAIGLGVAAASAIAFAVGNARAAKKGGEPFVLQWMRTVGYRQLPVAVPDMPMVDPDSSSKGPRLIEWVMSEQARGRNIMVPSVYYQGLTTGSPSQIVSVDPRVGDAIASLGVFKKLSTVK